MHELGHSVHDHSPERGPSNWQNPSETPLPRLGGMVQVPVGGIYRVWGLQWGCLPEMEMLSHRPSEHQLPTRTKETGVMDCFSLRGAEEQGPKLSPLGTAGWEATIFTLIL